MDALTAWEEILTALGIQEPTPPDTMRTVVRTAVIALVTLWLGGWAQKRIRLEARKRNAYADAVSLMSRAVALVIYVIGGAIILATLGVDPSVITTILAAATLGSTIAMQDVARGFINGLYIFVERPYKIGDSVRVGDVEGRVEEIGIRTTRVRAETGERVIVPNSLVFTSAVEKQSTGQLDRKQFHVAGIKEDILVISSKVSKALKGTAHVSVRGPIVDVVSAGPEGATAVVTVEYDLGHRIDDVIISKLHAAFPEATVTSGATGNDA